MKDNVCVEGLVDDNSYHGYFTTVVEAEKIEDALKKFRDLIFRLHSEEDMLDGINEVFLDADSVKLDDIKTSFILARNNRLNSFNVFNDKNNLSSI